jgi:hypothetical protein
VKFTGRVPECVNKSQSDFERLPVNEWNSNRSALKNLLDQMIKELFRPSNRLVLKFRNSTCITRSSDAFYNMCSSKLTVASSYEQKLLPTGTRRESFECQELNTFAASCN